MQEQQHRYDQKAADYSKTHYAYWR